MDLIKFACPGCGKRFSATMAKAGSAGKCVACGAILAVPAASNVPAIGSPRSPLRPPSPSNDGSARPVARPFPAKAPDGVVATSETAACPSCGKLIRVAARKCNWCGFLVHPPEAKKPSRAENAGIAREFQELNRTHEEAEKVIDSGRRRRDFLNVALILAVVLALGFGLPSLARVDGKHLDRDVFMRGLMVGVLVIIGLSYRLVAAVVLQEDTPFYKGILITLVAGGTVAIPRLLGLFEPYTESLSAIAFLFLGAICGRWMFRTTYGRALAIVFLGNLTGGLVFKLVIALVLLDT